MATTAVRTTQPDIEYIKAKIPITAVARDLGLCVKATRRGAGGQKITETVIPIPLSASRRRRTDTAASCVMRNQEVRFQHSPGKPEIPHARMACAEWGADELIAIEVDESNPFVSKTMLIATL